MNNIYDENEGTSSITMGATILSVNPVANTFTATLNQNSKIIEDIPLTPIAYSRDGAVIKFMPTKDTQIYLEFPSDNGPVRLAGYKVLVDTDSGTYMTDAPLLNPGDIYLATSSSQLLLAKGGAILMKTGSLANILMTPMESRIAITAKNHETLTPGTTVQHLTRSDKKNGDKTPVLTHIEVKENAEDDPLITIESGKTEDFDDDTLLGIKIKDKLKITLSKDGKVNFETEDEIYLKSKKKITLDTEDNIVLKANMLDATQVSSLKFGGENDDVALASKVDDILGLIVDAFMNNASNLGVTSMGGVENLLTPLSSLVQAKAKISARTIHATKNKAS